MWSLEILGFHSPWLAPSHLCLATQLLLWLRWPLLLSLRLLSCPWLLGSFCLLLPSELAFLVPLSRLIWLWPPFPVVLISLWLLLLLSPISPRPLFALFLVFLSSLFLLLLVLPFFQLHPTTFFLLPILTLIPLPGQPLPPSLSVPVPLSSIFLAPLPPFILISASLPLSLPTPQLLQLPPTPHSASFLPLL